MTDKTIRGYWERFAAIWLKVCLWTGLICGLASLLQTTKRPNTPLLVVVIDVLAAAIAGGLMYGTLISLVTAIFTKRTRAND